MRTVVDSLYLRAPRVVHGAYVQIQMTRNPVPSVRQSLCCRWCSPSRHVQGRSSWGRGSFTSRFPPSPAFWAGQRIGWPCG